MSRYAFALLMLMGMCPAYCVAEDLSAPPSTTSKAWAVADRSSGKLLASQRVDEPLKAASTTKAMSALVVLELAKVNPGLLNELITVSKLADDTAGSTAGVRSGEKLSVRDGLYALMLASGNDVGNALAEHFHPRLDPPDESAPIALLDSAYETRRNFIAEMNRTATRLGMQRTAYLESYGDGGAENDHTTTARDLVTLGRAAMQHSLFRDIVRTQEHTGKILRPDGTVGKARWKNTNKLLALGDYDGVKTGVTESAGYCLLASGSKNRVSLLVVILGGISSESRYADARNLFRWRWGMADEHQRSESSGTQHHFIRK